MAEDSQFIGEMLAVDRNDRFRCTAAGRFRQSAGALAHSKCSRWAHATAPESWKWSISFAAMCPYIAGVPLSSSTHRICVTV